MSSKMSIIADTWDDWLDRYVPPTNLRANGRARQAEIDSHVRVISLYAPQSAIEQWLTRLTDSLDRSMKTSAWPRSSEIEAACMAIRREDAAIAPRPSHNGDNDRNGVDPFKVAASRIQAGYPVGEGYLWGRSAVVLLRRGLVTQSEIATRRDDAIAAMAEVWPPEQIAQHVADLENQHAAGVTLEDAARRQWASDRADAERRAAEAKASIAINRMPRHQQDQGRMQEAQE